MRDPDAIEYLELMSNAETKDVDLWLMDDSCPYDLSDLEGLVLSEDVEDAIEAYFEEALKEEGPIPTAAFSDDVREAFERMEDEADIQAYNEALVDDDRTRYSMDEVMIAVMRADHR